MSSGGDASALELSLDERCRGRHGGTAISLTTSLTPGAAFAALSPHRGGNRLRDVGIVALARAWQVDLDLVGDCSDAVDALGCADGRILLGIARDVPGECDRAALDTDADVGCVDRGIPPELVHDG